MTEKIDNATQAQLDQIASRLVDVEYSNEEILELMVDWCCGATQAREHFFISYCIAKMIEEHLRHLLDDAGHTVEYADKKQADFLFRILRHGLGEGVNDKEMKEAGYVRHDTVHFRDIDRSLPVLRAGEFQRLNKQNIRWFEMVFNRQSQAMQLYLSQHAA